LLHRDVKPENVLVDREGRPKLADFGIAILTTGTPTTGVAGTIAYMPPELFQGAPSSVAADLYSLGATLFALATGSPPFSRPGDESVAATIHRALTETPPDLRRWGAPGVVADVINTLLEREPGARPSSANAAAEALQAAQQATATSITALPSTTVALGPMAHRRSIRRARLPVATLIVAGLALAGSGAALLLRRDLTSRSGTDGTQLVDDRATPDTSVTPSAVTDSTLATSEATAVTTTTAGLDDGATTTAGSAAIPSTQAPPPPIPEFGTVDVGFQSAAMVIEPDGLWAIGQSAVGQVIVVRLDPSSLAETARVDLPQSATSASVHAGLVWYLDRADPDNEVVHAIDPSTLKSAITLGGWPDGTGLRATVDAMWVVSAGMLHHVDLAAGMVDCSIVFAPATAPTSSVARPCAPGTATESFVVLADNRSIVVDPATATAVESALGDVAAATRGFGSYWRAGQGPDGSVIERRSSEGAVSATIPVPGAQLAIAVDGASVWVASDEGDLVRIDPPRTPSIPAFPSGTIPSTSPPDLDSCGSRTSLAPRSSAITPAESRRTTGRGWSGHSAARHQVLDERSHAAFDLVTDRAHSVEALPGRIIESPVEIPGARIERTVIAAAHRDDDIRRFDGGPVEELRAGAGRDEIDTELGHGLHDRRVDRVGRCGPGGADDDRVARVMGEERGRHLRAPGIVDAHEQHLGTPRFSISHLGPSARPPRDPLRGASAPACGDRRAGTGTGSARSPPPRRSPA
jgi:hypothetical protein